jgi:hypothetical protein
LLCRYGSQEHPDRFTVFDAVATVRDALMRLGAVSKSLCTKLWNSVLGVKLRGLIARGRTGNGKLRGFFAALRMTIWMDNGGARGNDTTGDDGTTGNGVKQATA